MQFYDIGLVRTFNAMVMRSNRMRPTIQIHTNQAVSFAKQLLFLCISFCYARFTRLNLSTDSRSTVTSVAQ